MCLATPRYFLDAGRWPAITNIRVSSDRFERQKWNAFLYTSELAREVGLLPWSDVFMSNETDNLLLATLSAGLVGVGDALGHVDATSLLRSVRGDGVIVKPDAPIVPLDSSYIADASAASALSAKTAARGRRNAGTGKSNQSAPKAHATPINNTNQPTLKRSKRTTKRHTCRARGFTWGSEDCFIFRRDVRRLI